MKIVKTDLILTALLPLNLWAKVVVGNAVILGMISNPMFWHRVEFFR
ncbi:hypothetical protein ACE4RU_08510 [Actinobacillus seminis]